MPELLKKSELARMLRVDVRTISAWVKNGRLPAPIKLGPSSLRFRLSDIQKTLADLGLTLDPAA